MQPPLRTKDIKTEPDVQDQHVEWEPWASLLQANSTSPDTRFPEPASGPVSLLSVLPVLADRAPGNLLLATPDTAINLTPLPPPPTVPRNRTPGYQTLRPVHPITGAPAPTHALQPSTSLDRGPVVRIPSSTPSSSHSTVPDGNMSQVPYPRPGGLQRGLARASVSVITQIVYPPRPRPPFSFSDSSRSQTPVCPTPSSWHPPPNTGGQAHPSTSQPRPVGAQWARPSAMPSRALRRAPREILSPGPFSATLWPRTPSS